ncbi:hypothetical protein ASD31_07965 [Rhizobium sp. Root482]|nr:hypothetical protein ASD31_07965 [Rhizobium sp. Root482]
MELHHFFAHPAIMFTKEIGAVMDCQAIEKYDVPKVSWFERALKAAMDALTARPPKYPRLELEPMSNYMRRDLGFMDGRAPREDCDLTR